MKRRRWTHRLDGVRSVVEWAERQSAQGRWTTLFLSYESAPAFDPHMVTRRPGAFPLAWASSSEKPEITPVPGSTAVNDVSPHWTATLSEAEYIRAVRRIQGLIARGDTYQANFTFPLRASWRGNPQRWFSQLALGQPTPYSLYADLGRWKVLSLSPELFFERRGDVVTVRPMKGSAPRGRWPQEDRARAEALRQSSKEQAENVMIVDLLRSDLGKIARPGSVRTTRLFHAEAYPTVWQMTSDIEARLRPGVGLCEFLTAVFPSGSVTGAPKRRTMEILRTMEKHPRGLYTGALGRLDPDGRWTFSVGIRTVIWDSRTQKAVCPVGSGITSSSEPKAEYRECLLKGEFLRPRSFDLLETLRLKGGRFFLLSGHLRRLKASAVRWGFLWNEKNIRQALAHVAAERRAGPWKVRLIYSRDGSSRCQSQPLTEIVKPWRLALAPGPVDEQDPLLYHKTTRRDLYQRARALRPEADDVLLWNRRREITESSIANMIYRWGGRWYTPPVACGLLNGVMRDAWVRRGRLKERILPVDDLPRVESIRLLNSVRGQWTPHFQS